MNSGHTVFRQLLQYLPRHEFNVCVSRYRGEYWSKSFSTFDQFLCLAYDHERLFFAPLIEEHFSKTSDFRCYQISVNGRKIKRPYSDIFQITTNVNETINDIDFFLLLVPTMNQLLWVGMLKQTS